MSTLLKIDVSTRGPLSISRKLSSRFLEQWRQVHTNGKVIERDIATTEIPFSSSIGSLQISTRRPPEPMSKGCSSSLAMSWLRNSSERINT
jgi:FMN-dependent NADH-azoreductase